ncbi:MAG TPA: TonB-dependent receptor, partial [Bryobacteraceae bacterium]|nr:TonB-dependent receptor [Bryobacteraceae bacterium]
APSCLSEKSVWRHDRRSDLHPQALRRKDRTFFFFAEQSTRTRNAATGTATVPIEAWKRGDYSDLRNGNGALITIYDPLTVSCESACDTPSAVYVRQPFPGNRIPMERFDPVARNLLQYFPQPNARPVNQFTNQNNFFASGKSPSEEDKFDSRIDHNFSDQFRMYGRGSYLNSSSSPFNAYGNIANAVGGNSSNTTQNYNVSVNGVYTFSPTTILNVNYGFARQVILSTPISQGIDLTTLGFPQAVQSAASQQNLEFPDIQFAGNTNLTKLGQATFSTLNMVPYSHIIRPDVTKVFSRHTVKFGGEFRKLFMNFRQHGQPSGSYTFNSGYTQRVIGAAASQTQGNGFASFLLGIANNGNMEHTYATASASEYFGLYVQDDWKVSQKLTLNLGLRYDVDVPRTERYNRLSYFDIDAPSPIAGLVPGYENLKGAMRFTTPDNRRQTPTDLNNWGPRFGFAYQVAQKTVFRGAYALMYSGSVMQAAGTSGSSGTEGFTGSTNMIVSNNGGRTVEATLSNPYPNGFNFPLGSAEGPISGANTNLGLGIGASYFNDYRNPLIQQWNTNIQQEFGEDFLIEVGYLGSKGNHLIDGESNMTYNQLPASYFALGNQLLGTNQVPNPFFGVITNPTSTLSQRTIPYSQLLRPYPQYTSVNAFRKPQANSIYHSFTLRAEKRFSDGLNLLVSFTGGKLIDDASQTVTFLGEAGQKQDFYNRAAERSISTQDVSRRLVISGNYEIPIGRTKAHLASIPRALDFVIGGWQLNGIASFQTGVPLKISNGGNNTNLGSPGQRPNNNGQSAKLDNPTMERYFDTSVFSQAPNFTFGNTSRTSPDLRAPSQNNLDASIFKRFRATERTTVEFRAEAFNATNTPIWNTPAWM